MMDKIKKLDESLQTLFDYLASTIELVVTRWWGFLLWILAPWLLMPIWWWDGVDRSIYVIGYYVLPIILKGSRRENMATQAKQDALIEAVPGADDRLRHIEDRSELDIEEARR